MVKKNKDTSKLNTSKLSIQIDLNGLSFCIFDVSSNTIMSLKHFKKDKILSPLDLLDHLKFVVDTEHLKPQSFTQITLIYRNELSSLVPKELYVEDNSADYLKFNNKILPTDFIASDDLLSDLVNVYVPLVNINNYVYDTFGSFTYQHFSSIYIDYLLSLPEHSQGQRMYVNIGDGLFETVALKEGKLVLYNSFAYTSNEDFIYYILFTAEQLAMDPEHFSLIFTGSISEDSSLFSIAYKYVRHVSIHKAKINFTLADENIKPEENLVLLNSFQ